MLGTFAAVAPIVLARVFVVGNYQIPSDSMLPTLRRGDRVWGEKISARRGAVAASDIVTFHDPRSPRRTLIKRVIATGGQTVDLRDGIVLVDGEPLSEHYLKSSGTYPFGASAVSYPVHVPQGSVWVMGDNRKNSFDSRFFGPVTVSALTSRVVYRYWPLEQARRL